MRHYKRIVSTLLAAGMGLSLLTGCQSGQQTGGTAEAEKRMRPPRTAHRIRNQIWWSE